jgi:hypothetical protein
MAKSGHVASSPKANAALVVRALDVQSPATGNGHEGGKDAARGDQEPAAGPVN